ncbi:MAG: glycoside hydrolase family 92 protein, partial [Proteobacteria bacterium]|nr:glycoside hydrolase family 92 protein [Pseudomonadota bacterium]
YDTRLELAPSERCAFLRFSFPDTQEASVVFRAEGEIHADEASGKRRILGKATHVTFGAPAGFGTYFVAEFDQPYETIEVRREGKKFTSAIRFSRVRRGTPVSMRIGTSFIDHEQAALNLRREMPDWDFKGARTRARSAWAKALARVEIRGGSPAQRSTFYTALYRSLQFPRMFHEPDAQGRLRHYSPFADGKVLDGPLYTDNGLWDTFRTAFPLLVLYYPERSAEILEGWLNAYREGGRLPNWPSPGNRPCMIGSHSDSIFADAWVKGIRSFDLQEAYAATRKNAFENDAWGWAGRDHLDDYIRLGYMPADLRKEAATSCTLEYAYDDYCVARLALAAGRLEDHERLLKRAGNYRNVWDPETGFMRGRLQDGRWQEPFDPLAWGGSFVEGNAWQWLWSVQ